MARRKSMTDLIAATPPQAETPDPAHESERPAETAPRQLKPVTVPTEPAGPRYLQLARKEARITHEQADALASLTRRLNRQRHGTGERITDNTLLRVAVDLLLTREDELRGTTEPELRNSVGL